MTTNKGCLFFCCVYVQGDPTAVVGGTRVGPDGRPVQVIQGVSQGMQFVPSFMFLLNSTNLLIVNLPLGKYTAALMRVTKVTFRKLMFCP